MIFSLRILVTCEVGSLVLSKIKDKIKDIRYKHHNVEQRSCPQLKKKEKIKQNKLLNSK